MNRKAKRTLAVIGTLAFTALAVYANVGAGASQPPGPPPAKATRPHDVVMKDISEGRARKVKAFKHTTAVWTGCKFVYLTTDESTWEFDDGSTMGLSENPDPMPPRDPNCVDRNPTRQEMDASEARASAANASELPQGVPVPPLPSGRYRGTT